MRKIQITQENKLSSMLISADTLYELSGTFDLAGEVIEIPSGCVLKFDEGTRIANGTLSLNNTVFEGAKHSIDALVSGNQYELDTDNFNLTGSDKVTIMQSIVSTATSIQLHGRLEDVFDGIQIGGKKTSLIGNGATIANTTVTNSAIIITDNSFVRIVDIDFIISSGDAIYKDVVPELNTVLSFMIDRCNFISTGGSSTAIIQLLGSREGNITNCFFKGSGKTGSIGINRQNAVNTNVIGCMFSNLSYGIKAIGVNASKDASSEEYSVFACGLNVQSAIMLGCKYGIYIEGNDSFFLNNSMIDYCDNPLVLMSQDGANITNCYFSTSTVHNDYDATITVRNNTSKGAENRNQRIIISGNTIYGHRTTNNYGIDMSVKSKDCIIQYNTIDYFIGHGIYMRNESAEAGWTTEKLVIDNNRFHFAYTYQDGIGGYTGDPAIIITNNYAMEGSTTKLMSVGSPHYGNYVYDANHDYLAAVPSGNEGSKVYYASRKNCTRMKIGLTMAANDSTLIINNPMNGDTNLVVYVANNRYPICVYSISSTQIVFTKTTSNAVTFTAIIEHISNM